MTARIRQVSGLNIAVLFTDLVLIVDNSAPCSIQLPNPAAWYYPLTIRALIDPSTAAHRVTLLRYAGETIAGAAGNVFLGAQPVTTVFSDFTNWHFTSGIERQPFSSVIDAVVTSQNDFNPTDWAPSQVVRMTSASAVAVTGLRGPGSLPKLLINANTNPAFTITIRHENASSQATNRVYCPGAVDFVLPIQSQGGSAQIWYDAAASRVMIF